MLLHQTKYVNLIMNYSNSHHNTRGQPDFSAHCLCHLYYSFNYIHVPLNLEEDKESSKHCRNSE